MISFFPKDIGIDLGTANTLIYVEGQGVILNEPSVVAVEKSTNKIISIGAEAKEMLGRTPNNIIAVRPMRDGVIADFDIVEKMIRYFIKKASGSFSLIKPRISIGVPTSITEVERRAVQESCEQAGVREMFIIEEPLAAAIGAGLPINEPLGNMIVDIGGGTTEIAVISLGSIVVENSIRVGGNEIDRSIINFFKQAYNLLPGDRTTERIKINFIDLSSNDKEVYSIKGRDAISGLPRAQEVSQLDMREAIREPLESIIAAIKGALDRTPPELAADIIDQGIVLTGGGALLKGLKNYVSANTGVPVILAKDPTLCVAKGTGIYLQQIKSMKWKKRYIKI